MFYKTKILFLLAALLSVPCHAKDLGVVGATYEIAEKDALTEIEQRVMQVNWDKYFNKKKFEKSAKNYKPETLVSLPKADKDRAFAVDLTCTLDFDIPDGRDGVLYPKGYTFNPLEYVNYGTTLVIIDGSDKEQVEWFKKSQYSKDYRSKLLFTGGSAHSLAEKLKRPIYYADRTVVEGFRLNAVPSVVIQKGKMMEVREIDIEKGKNK